MTSSQKSSPSPSPSIDLQIDEAYQDVAPTIMLLAAVQATLAREKASHAEVAIVVTGDELLHQLNLEYRGIDAPTDVLSFSAQEELGETATAFVTAPEAEAYLGDVILSYPMASRQAQAAGHSVANELCLLAVHGVLHLLGYDHATAEEEAAMWAIQDAVLAGLPREP
jgi:probable rRNA maturation factor